MDNLMLMDWVYLIGLMFALAGLAGFLAGLLGIGGGLVLVPGLYFVFTHLGYQSEAIMHLAVGTSLTTIVATGISSARAHHKKGSVRFDLVKRIGIGIVIGVGVGTYIASVVSGLWLQIFFAVTLVILAGLMRVNPEKIKLFDDVPPQPWSGLAGMGIGIVSTLMGIGGAALNVPYMTLSNVPIHKAVGSSSAMGLLVAIPGAIGFLMIGWGHTEGLPPLSFGYINLLALMVIVPVTVLFAPLGVHVAHKFSTKKLRSVFSIFMIVIAIRMIAEVVSAL
ncbi:MAG TPA: sulfite exporter TauE/SafE family protein [Alphaproteobacteria bacterium]|nr:sulfite exporter TauE/SafE family protein [Alphaproteobacteria bacterium]